MWVISGYTREVGVWDVELYEDYDKAKWQFDYYVSDYDAWVENYTDGSVTAMCKDGVGRFFLQYVEIRR